jgi:hypothetical protein
VDELIVDTAAMRVRYIDVDLDRSVRDKVRNPAAPRPRAPPSWGATRRTPSPTRPTAW